MNVNELYLHNQLEEVVRMKEESRGTVLPQKIWNICHDLAESQYQPALSFFLEGLKDPNWIWRQRCLQMIGFHYDIPSDGEIIDKVRNMLLSDPDENVRMTAASVLGTISGLPDQFLINALKSDPDWFVRRSAYLALLQLAGVNYELYIREDEKFNFESEEIEPTINELNRVLKQEGISLPPNTFGPEDLDV